MITLNWSTWIDLDADLKSYRQHVAAMAGFYRIRVKQQESLAYIGQTGRIINFDGIPVSAFCCVRNNAVSGCSSEKVTRSYADLTRLQTGFA